MRPERGAVGSQHDKAEWDGTESRSVGIVRVCCVPCYEDLGGGDGNGLFHRSRVEGQIEGGRRLLIDIEFIVLITLWVLFRFQLWGR